MRFLFALALCAIGAIGSAADRGPRLYTVENYDVRIEPDLAARHLTGEVKIRIRSLADADISAFELDAGEIRIDSVKEGQAAQWFERSQGKLFVSLTNPLRPDEPRTVTIAYRAGPAAGLRFFNDQIYTSAVSDWLPCNDQPGERARLHLTIAAAAGMKATASGQPSGPGEWQLDSPAAPSWFGFALGNFVENTSEAGGVTLRALGAGPAVLGPAAAAMRYLAESTGKAYPGRSYTEVFVHGGETRAMAGGLTLLPESAAEDRFRMASELARQWYGVSIATKNAADAWLSAGVSAFLAERFLGKEQVEQEKGAVFLRRVNQLLGDSAFDQGLKLFTSGAWDKTATSEDLQHAFDAVNTGKGAEKLGKKRGKSAKDAPNALDALFESWMFAS
jgi:aminopeptidase N